MDHRDWVELKDIARLEGVAYQTIKKRLQRARIVTMTDPEDARRILAPVTFLSPQARQDWLSDQIASALQPHEGPQEAPTTADLKLPPGDCSQASVAPAPLAMRLATTLQPVLPFAPPSASQAARDAVVAAVPKAQRPYVAKWMAIISDNVNGTWRVCRGKDFGGYPVRTREDFQRGQAHLYDISMASIYAKLRVARKIIKDPEIPQPRKWSAIAESLVPRPRPGRSGHSFFADPENMWMFPKLREFYLNQARLSATAAHALLIDLIEKKQRGWGIGHYYQRPTLSQTRTAIEQIPEIERILGREGEKAFNDRCGKYISRDPSTLRANDLWVTDQKEIDVRLRDGGERLGRIWMVNLLDVASDKILGYAFGPVLDSDMVMMAAAMALERYGVPRAIHMDLGKEFICKAFTGGVRKISGEALYREAVGLWKELNVEPVKAIGRNPQSKTIERWHANLPDFDRRFPGYCGSSPDTRPEKLAEEEAQHLAWLAGKAQRSPLVTISQYIRAYCYWIEGDPKGWNQGARGRGKMRRGMTPDEAWNAKQPVAGRHIISADEVDHATAEHRFVKIARGGQVNLTFYGQLVEYEAPELFPHQGEDVEAIVSRRTFRQVTVIYPVPGGHASCVAKLKPQMEWLPENRDELRAAIRCKAAVHRAIRQGVKASRVALEVANPVELLQAEQALPAKKQIQKMFGTPEISSTESIGERMGLPKRPRQRTSEEVAEAALALERNSEW